MLGVSKLAAQGERAEAQRLAGSGDRDKLDKFSVELMKVLRGFRVPSSITICRVIVEDKWRGGETRAHAARSCFGSVAQYI